MDRRFTREGPKNLIEAFVSCGKTAKETAQMVIEENDKVESGEGSSIVFSYGVRQMRKFYPDEAILAAFQGTPYKEMAKKILAVESDVELKEAA